MSLLDSGLWPNLQFHIENSSDLIELGPEVQVIFEELHKQSSVYFLQLPYLIYISVGLTDFSYTYQKRSLQEVFNLS